jgi:hypothetical protein
MATREGSFSVEDMKNVQINIGAVVKEADEWDQEMGPFPKPGVATLRSTCFGGTAYGKVKGYETAQSRIDFVFDHQRMSKLYWHER